MFKIMKRRWFLVFIQQLCLILILPHYLVAESNHRYVRRIPLANFELNRLPSTNPEIPFNMYNEYPPATRDDAILMPHQSMVSFITNHNKHSLSNVNFQHNFPSGSHTRHNPLTNTNRHFNKTKFHYRKMHKTPYSISENPEFMKSGNSNKENIYVESDNTNKENLYDDRPQFPLSYSEPFDQNESKYSEFKVNSEMLANRKKINNFQKPQMFQYSFSDENEGSPSEVQQDNKLTITGTLSKPRSFSMMNSETRISSSAPTSQHQDDHTEIFPPSKNSQWKQLGPNVEISASSDDYTFSKSNELSSQAATFSAERRKKKRKSPYQGQKSSFMAPQQHALYIANNIHNLKIPKEGFDHSNVLKQSNKFDLTDAMHLENEKKLIRSNDAKTKFSKQMSSKNRPYNFEMPDYQAFQYVEAPISNSMVNLPYPIDVNSILTSKYGYNFYQPQAAAVTKAFIKNVEIETNSAPGKKTVTALVIPLEPNSVFNDESYVARNSFPYDVLNSRYAPPNEFANYQFKQYIPYNVRIGQNADDDFSTAYDNSQTMYSRTPYRFISTTYAPSTAIDDKPSSTDTAYSTISSYPNQSRPFAIIVPNKT